jgi:predicted transcriptional regulator
VGIIDNPKRHLRHIIEMIDRLPDTASIEDIIEAIRFRQKVDEGLRQLDAGEGIEHEEARRKLGKWLR